MRNAIPSRATISHNDYKGRGDTESQVVSLVLRHVAENCRTLTHDAEEVSEAFGSVDLSRMAKIQQL